jgi:hypothetical protein
LGGFVAGLAMTLVGCYLFLDRVTVHGGYWHPDVARGRRPATGKAIGDLSRRHLATTEVEDEQDVLAG